MKNTESSLGREILSYVREERLITGAGIQAMHIGRNNYNSRAEKIPEELDRLVLEKKLKALYPKGVNWESARMAETYYIIS